MNIVPARGRLVRNYKLLTFRVRALIAFLNTSPGYHYYYPVEPCRYYSGIRTHSILGRSLFPFHLSVTNHLYSLPCIGSQTWTFRFEGRTCWDNIMLIHFLHGQGSTSRCLSRYSASHWFERWKWPLFFLWLHYIIESHFGHFNGRSNSFKSLDKVLTPPPALPVLPSAADQRPSISISSNYLSRSDSSFRDWLTYCLTLRLTALDCMHGRASHRAARASIQYQPYILPL